MECTVRVASPSVMLRHSPLLKRDVRSRCDGAAARKESADGSPVGIARYWFPLLGARDLYRANPCFACLSAFGGVSHTDVKGLTDDRDHMQRPSQRYSPRLCCIRRSGASRSHEPVMPDRLTPARLTFSFDFTSNSICRNATGVCCASRSRYARTRNRRPCAGEQCGRRFSSWLPGGFSS
jgi:hypothetical protein